LRISLRIHHQLSGPGLIPAYLNTVLPTARARLNGCWLRSDRAHPRCRWV